MQIPTISGYLYAFSAAALWSLLGSLGRFCFAHGMEPIEAAFWRAAIGGLFFLLHALFCRQIKAKPKHALIFVLYGICGVAVFFSVFQIAVKESGAALAVILLYTAPLWVAIFSRILFHEAISKCKVLALAIAMTGTLLVCVSGGSLSGTELSVIGIACGVAAGFTYAMQYAFFVWWKSRYANATIFSYVLLAAAAALFPFLHISFNKEPEVWAAIFALGFLTTYGAYWVYGEGLRRISPVRAVILSNLEPVLGIFLAWFFWDETFSMMGWAGSCLVLVAVFLLTFDHNTQN